MDIDALYPLVTEAIRRAEALEDSGAPDARGAFSEVSQLEEQIASFLPLCDYEGVVARRGAVRAAIKAHEFGRAQQRAARYLAEDELDNSLKADLADLRRQAEAKTDGRQNRPVPAHNFSIVARFIPKRGNGRVTKQTFSSIERAAARRPRQRYGCFGSRRGQSQGRQHR